MKVRSSRLLSPMLGLVVAGGMLTAGALVFGDHEPADHKDQPIAVSHSLTLAGAEKVIAAATAFAQSRNAGGAISVVDSGGHLIALHRLDGTFPAASDVATGKARTAATFRKATSAFEDAIKNGRVALVGVDQMLPLQGGIPIIHDGFVVGAVGVSGAHSAAEDEEVAAAGVAAITSESR